MTYKTFSTLSLFTSLIILCFSTAVITDSASATTRRGAIALNGRYSVRSNGCKLQFGTLSTSSTTRIRCLNSGRARDNAVSGKGVAYLKLKDSIILTGKSCFLKKLIVTKTRIDLLCQAEDPDATPTPTATPTVTPTANANAVSQGPSAGVVNNLIAFNTDNSAGADTAITVSGLTAGDILVAVDRRPQNGMLYGLGYNASTFALQLYAISSDKAVATAIGSTGTFVASDGSTPIQIGNGSTTLFDMDFNPTVDRIRVVTSTSQNFRINPNTGAFVDGNLGTGGAVTGLNMDGDIQGNTTTVQGAAYTNNQSNATVTTLYTLDSAGDLFCRQSPANAGTQVCSSLGQPLDAVIGFDIQPGINTTASDVAVSSGFGYSIVRTAGSAVERLAKIDLVSGAVTPLAAIGVNQPPMIGISVMQPDGVAMVALNEAGDTLRRLNSKTPGTVTSVSMTGVTAGDVLVGLDYRPSTGQLYSLGINAAADTGTLYMLDPQTGAATVVGSAGLVAFVDASSSTIDLPAITAGYGFNFNPVVDRIRVVTGTGLNFRINPSTGAPVDGDTGAGGTQPDSNINGVTTTVHGGSYTNSSAGNTATTLYTLDAVSNSLYLQIAPNTGLQAAPIPVTLGGAKHPFLDP